MGQFQVRTDLALEAREKFQEDNVEIKGVRVEEERREELEIKITTMAIETENGAKAMGMDGILYDGQENFAEMVMAYIKERNQEDK